MASGLVIALSLVEAPRVKQMAFLSEIELGLSPGGFAMLSGETKL